MKNSLLLALICSALMACGGSGVSIEGGKVNVETVNTVPKLQAVRVLASGVDASGVGMINSGDFAIEWDATAVDASTFNLYLSQDAVKSDSDIEFFITANPQANKKASLKWDESLDLLYVSGVPLPIKSFFDKNPLGQGFVIARGCGVIIDTANGERKSCVEKTVAVKLNKKASAASALAAI
ncbi:MAG: hypothetical protein ACRC01_07610 [Deefgea sp.]